MNPIAGMGGAVGLKGTDGEAALREAVARGAKRTAPERACAALLSISSRCLDLDFVTCSGDMGETELKSADMEFRVVYRPKDPTTRKDTIDAARTMQSEDANLIVFAGGDGTARDVVEAVDGSVALIGIPAGVKMHSAVFATTPSEVADLVESFAHTGATREAEVMDVDEEGVRQGVLRAKLFGYAKVPDDLTHLQASKMDYHAGSAEDEAEELGQYIADTLEKGMVYVLGPGSTLQAVARKMGIEKTLLGVDVVLDNRVLCPDASEKDILRVIGEHPRAKIVVTPIGAQGFVLGRGNQQISPEVIERVGIQNLVVIATPTKLKHTPVLRVDTGTPALDAKLRGPRRVITGYKRRRLLSIQ